MEWRDKYLNNVTLTELNDELVLLHIPTIVFIAILIVVGVLGNIYVIYIYTTKYSPSTYRSFIIWLGYIDLMACILGMPLLIVSMLYPYQFPSVAACRTFRFLHVLSVVSSAFIVLAIAFERHRRICDPFSQEMTTWKINVLCLIASVLGFVVAVPAILLYGDAEVDTGVNNITGHECFIDPTFNNTFPRTYFICQLLLSVVSTLTMGIFYFRIGGRIWSHHHFIRSNTYPWTVHSKDRKLHLSDCCKKAEEINDKVAAEDKNRVWDISKCTFDVPYQSSSSFHEDTSDKPIDDINIKADEYGEFNKKVVQIKSRSNSPISNKSLQDSKAAAEDDYSERRCRQNSSRSPSERSINGGPSLRTRQVTFMLFMITVVFILSFIPHLILMVLITMDPNFTDDFSPFMIALYNFFLRSFVINNMANPIIYSFCDKKFRAECAKLGLKIITCGQR